MKIRIIVQILQTVEVNKGTTIYIPLKINHDQQ